MADVAEALGVAKGTLYLCVESKEALFDVALRYADAPRPIAAPPTLPVPTPPRGRTLRHVQERLARDPASPTLREALGRGRANASAEELAKIARELHQAMARNRTGIKLVDRCAAEYPELAKVWFGMGRGALLGPAHDVSGTRHPAAAIPCRSRSRRGRAPRHGDARVLGRPPTLGSHAAAGRPARGGGHGRANARRRPGSRNAASRDLSFRPPPAPAHVNGIP